LKKPIKFKPDFEIKLTKDDIGVKIPAFFGNPEKNWGPKTKAKAKKY